MTIRNRIPAICVFAGGAALAVILLLPAAARWPIGNGAAFVFSTYAEALAIVGLGVALSRLPRRRPVSAGRRLRKTGARRRARQPAAYGVLLFVAGVLVGWAVKDRILSALVQRPGSFEYTGFIGPLACLLSGAALAAPGRHRRVVTPAVAVLAGIAIGFVAALNDPSLGESQFFAGAALASYWLLLAPLAILPPLDAAYVAIGGRILASWLIAIGLMLGAAKMFRPQLPVPAAEPVGGQSTPAFGVPDDLRFEPRGPAVLRAPAD